MQKFNHWKRGFFFNSKCLLSTDWSLFVNHGHILVVVSLILVSEVFQFPLSAGLYGTTYIPKGLILAISYISNSGWLQSWATVSMIFTNNVQNPLDAVWTFLNSALLCNIDHLSARKRCSEVKWTLALNYPISNWLVLWVLKF